MNGKQNTLALGNVYLPRGELEADRQGAQELAEWIQEWVQEMLGLGYDVLVMGDLNHATTAQDRESNRLHQYDKEYGKWVERWGLKDIWVEKLGNKKWGQAGQYTYRKGHTIGEGDRPGGVASGKEARPPVMSRIDYALCNKELLPWVNGIGLDTVQRLQGMDHRFLMVDLNPDYFASDNNNSGIWLPEEPEYQTVPRIRLDNWGKEERKEFRKTLQDMMEEAKTAKPETTKPADLVYVGGKDRKYRDGAKGEWWEATRDPKRAVRWALASCQGKHSVTIRALQLDSHSCKLSGQLRLDTDLRNQKMGRHAPVN